MGRGAWSPTRAQLKTIKEMSAQNATQRAICEALGIGTSTFKRYKQKEDELGQLVPSVKKALNDGIKERINRIKNNCIDSLDLMTRQHVVKEVKRTRRKNQLDDGLGDIIDTTTTRKVVEPNATVVMFTSVNLMPERFQSINKVEVRQENNNAPSGFKMKWTKKPND